MSKVIGVLSMLHESADRCSATRLFRGEPVLKWTLRRLRRARSIDSIALLCWDDQLEAVTPIAEDANARVTAKGPRAALPEVDAIAAARRWADGWRGGLLLTCAFDRGYHASWHHELARLHEAEAVILVDPSAGLVDPELIDALAEHAKSHDTLEIVFSPAAPGLGGILMRPALLGRLASANTHPGRLLHYHPDQPSREPLAAESCTPVPTSAARTIHRFTLDSDRQVGRFAAATEPLNGELVAANAEEMVSRLQSIGLDEEMPREVVLELCTRRSTRPIFWPGRAVNINRPELTLAQVRPLLEELSSIDDTRLTLAGVGDPLLAPDVFAIVDAAQDEAGLSVNLETDLNGIESDAAARLARAQLDVLSVHLPALSPQTYAKVMGSDAYGAVLENVRRFVSARQTRRSGVPILAPIFTKCRENLGEMEAWYDQWLRAAGSAVIRGPSDCAGQIPDVSVADMAPPARKACARLTSRITVLSDGRVVSCEEDILGTQVLGRVGVDSIREVWQKRLSALREDHRRGEWNHRPLCRACREWHRA